MPENEDPRCWIVQRCTERLIQPPLKTTPEGYLVMPLPVYEYENWPLVPSEDKPMTHTEMMAALEVCEKVWPDDEFRGHRISRISSEAGTPGSPAKSEEPGILQEVE